MTTWSGADRFGARVGVSVDVLAMMMMTTWRVAYHAAMHIFAGRTI
jgi:hypothetical protein